MIVPSVPQRLLLRLTEAADDLLASLSYEVHLLSDEIREIESIGQVSRPRNSYRICRAAQHFAVVPVTRQTFVSKQVTDGQQVLGRATLRCGA